MEQAVLSFFARLWLAIWLPWKLLFDGAAAWRVERAARGELPAAPQPEALPAARPEAARPEAPKPQAPARPDHGQALHLLAILQREGRFVDFLNEDIAQLPDGQVGAAARVVHEGCRKAILPYVKFEPVRGEAEGAAVTLEAGFDPARVRLTGNVVGKPPFKGRLAHHGWQAVDVKLPAPPSGQDPSIVAPAEVEL